MHEKLQEFGYIYEDEEEEAKAAVMAPQEEEDQMTPKDENSKNDTDFTEMPHNSNGGDSIRITEMNHISRKNNNDIENKHQATSNTNISGIIE